MSFWLALLLAVPSRAAALSCAQTAADFDALRDCQAKARQALIDRVIKKTGSAPGDAALERFDDRQRAEASAFMARHTVGAGDLDLPAEEKAPAKPASSAAKSAGAKGASGSAADCQAGELAALKASMIDKSDGGKKGITPEMAGDMRTFLMKNQGGVSPEMSDLLDSTARDGVNLRTDTMQKLRKAGQAAKDNGMSLGIDPKTEDQLMNGDLNGAPGQAGPGNN